MAKMSPTTLRSILSSQRASALAATQSAKLTTEREQADRYYYGDMWDMPAEEGRSQAVSTDVSDAIEGLLPNLMDIFVSGDTVVQFEAVGPEDEDAAQQETDYVNHVFMSHPNNGIMILYTMFKDALLSKTGIVKVRWEEHEKEETETYYGLTADQFALVAQAVVQSDGQLEIIAHTERPINQEPNSEATS